MKTTSNVQAFPSAESTVSDRGMKLLDWFAGQALGGIYLKAIPKEAAKYAYDVAEAMFKEKEERKI